MKSNKRYTTQTFTKRPDHDGGLHRAAQKHADPAFCTRCEAAYVHGRWVVKGAAAKNNEEHWRPPSPTVCPACKQIESGVVGGYFTLGGKFFDNHREDVENLIANEAEKALEDNPLSRIMKRTEADGKVTIETTTEHLVQRFGHALKKAFDGEVSYDFSHENKVSRVKWHRD